MDYSLIANIRYGYGPGLNPVTDATPEALIYNMLKEDSVAEFFPVSDWKSAIPLHTKTTEAFQAYKAGREPESSYRSLYELRAQAGNDFCKSLIGRAMYGNSAFKERLVFFWSDHFSISRHASSLLRLLTPCFVNDAIRPHVSGRFSEMLRAITFHPAMLHYLNLRGSTGARSLAGILKGRTPNENFARESVSYTHLTLPTIYSV